LIFYCPEEEDELVDFFVRSGLVVVVGETWGLFG
jgi:hypothetical protein